MVRLKSVMKWLHCAIAVVANCQNHKISVMEIGCGRGTRRVNQATDASVDSYERREEVTEGFETYHRPSVGRELGDGL